MVSRFYLHFFYTSHNFKVHKNTITSITHSQIYGHNPSWSNLIVKPRSRLMISKNIFLYPSLNNMNIQNLYLVSNFHTIFPLYPYGFKVSKIPIHFQEYWFLNITTKLILKVISLSISQRKLQYVYQQSIDGRIQ